MRLPGSLQFICDKSMAQEAASTALRVLDYHGAPIEGMRRGHTGQICHHDAMEFITSLRLLHVIFSCLQLERKHTFRRTLRGDVQVVAVSWISRRYIYLFAHPTCWKSMVFPYCLSPTYEESTNALCAAYTFSAGIICEMSGRDSHKIGPNSPS